MVVKRKSDRLLEILNSVEIANSKIAENTEVTSEQDDAIATIYEELTNRIDELKANLEEVTSHE